MFDYTFVSAVVYACVCFTGLFACSFMVVCVCAFLFIYVYMCVYVFGYAVGCVVVCMCMRFFV